MTLYNTKLPHSIAFYDFAQTSFANITEGADPSGLHNRLHSIVCHTVGDVLNLVKSGFITVETARFELRRMGLELEDDCNYYYTYDLNLDDRSLWFGSMNGDKTRGDGVIEVIRKK